MKRFLFQIKPKFLFSAIIILIVSTVNVINSVPKPHYDFLGNLAIDQNPIIADEPLTPSNLTTSIDDPETPEDQSDESYDFSSDLIIRAVNPGYTNSDKLTNVGELIEV